MKGIPGIVEFFSCEGVNFSVWMNLPKLQTGPILYRL